MKLTVGQIIAALPSLSPGDLGAVETAVRALKAPDPQPEAETVHSPLFEAVSMLLNSMGLGPGSYTAFRKSKFVKAWDTGQAVVDQYVTKNFGRLKRNEQQALYFTVLPSLITMLRNQKVPISIGSVCANIGRLPDAFEECFPGYAQAGMGHIIIKRMRAKKD